MAANKLITINTPIGEMIIHPNRAKAILKYYENPNYCINCGNIINIKENEKPSSIRKKKFCCQSCSATYNNKLRKKYNLCLNCGKSIPLHNKFCDNSCKSIYNRNLKVENNPNDCTNHLLKIYLVNKYGYKCQECGNEEWLSKPIPIELEHIDGNSTNKELNNLKLLCPNCHALTPTYKGKNVGNGRHYRRQRYAEGKSY